MAVVKRDVKMFAEASQGEETTTYNLSGDQIGVELRTRRWHDYEGYSLGWATVFRVEDPAIAERIAQFMERAVTNGYFGYDQNGRNTMETQLGRVGYDPSAVHIPCEADCSMTAYEAVKYATGIDCKTNYDEEKDVNTGLSKTRDPKTGLCGETYFGSRSLYPVGVHFHYYMTRVLPLHGIKVGVYTLDGMDYKTSDGASALAPAITYERRLDFFPRNNYFAKCNGQYVTDLNGRRISFSHPYWKSRYYETPYEHYGITQDMIDHPETYDLSEFSETVDGVTYYNEIGKAVRDFNSRFGVENHSEIEDGGTIITGKYTKKGEIYFANLPNANAENSMNAYIITDKFTTTSAFAEGAGNEVPARSTVICELVDGSYKWRVFHGTIIAPSFQSHIYDKDGNEVGEYDTSGGAVVFIPDEVTIDWVEEKPYDALTYDQIGMLEKNLKTSIDNENKVGWLVPEDAGNTDVSHEARSYPINLKRGDLVLTRVGYLASEGSRIGYLEDGRIVHIPVHGSAGHIAVWI